MDSMDCATVREGLSARLDGEDPGTAPELLDTHVAGCAGCAAWLETAAGITRLTRLSPVAQPPEVDPEVYAGIRPRLSGAWLRWALVFAAICQFSVVVSQLLMPMPGVGGAMHGGHLQHETAAFNFAVAVGLLFVAARPHRARTQLPLLLSFVGVLVFLSIVDVLNGQVSWYRLTGHVPLLFGVLCTMLLTVGRWRAPEPGARGSSRGGLFLPGRGGETELAESPGTSGRYQPPAARRIA